MRKNNYYRSLLKNADKVYLVWLTQNDSFLVCLTKKEANRMLNQLGDQLYLWVDEANQLYIDKL